MLDRFAAFLDQHQRILLTTHENPDEDGIGAMVGLTYFLRSRGKEARIVVYPHLPPNLAWVDAEGWVEPFDAAGKHADLAHWPDAWIMVDASEIKRLGPLLPLFESTKAVKATLDHHLKDAPKGYDAEFTDPTATASGELVYDLAAPRMGLPLPAPMAEALYVSLVGDTGNFRHSNSTAKVHRMAAQLIEQGVQPARTFQTLYYRDRPERLRLMGRALEGLKVVGAGRYAYLAVSKADLEACGATWDDLDGFVEIPAKVDGVEVGALLYENREGVIKISLRSREAVDVNAICKSFGGGGHRLASGCKLEGPLGQAAGRLEEAVLARLELDLSSK
jgi:phosphoesterase RecJ-like protein